MWTGLSRGGRTRDATRLVPVVNLIEAFRKAEFVRTTTWLQFGAERAKPFIVEAERRLHEGAEGALMRTETTPAFAWLVGVRPSFELEVLEVVDRELTIFIANAMLEPQQVTVSFNGFLLGQMNLPVANRQVRETFSIPANMQRRGVNTVEIGAARTEMRKLLDEPMALPLAAILNRMEFVAVGQEATGALLPNPGVEAGEGEGALPRVVLPAGTALRTGLRLPDVDPVVLEIDVSKAEIPFELSMRASMHPRRVLIDSGATAGEHRLDLSAWAGQTVLLEIWAKGSAKQVQNGRGVVEIERGVLLVAEADAVALEPAVTPEPRGRISPSGETASYAEGKPSILFVVLDSLARERTSAYGYERPTTPNLALLAQRGWAATDVRAPASYTLASVATMLTGQEPLTHGVSVLPSAKSTLALAASAPRLAELLQEQGWRTAGWVANTNAGSQHGYADGFDVWEDLHDDPELAEKNIVDGRHMPPKLASFLATLGADEPFFAYAHVFEPHAPYDAPAELQAQFVEPGYDGPVDGSRTWINTWKARNTPVDAAGWAHLEQLYAARVAYADRVLGQLVEELERAGRAEDTIVVVASDHGEALGEHRAIEHGDLVYDEQIVVPLVFVVPGWSGGRIDAPATLSDIAPTLLGLAGIPPHPAMDGFDLFANTPGPERERLARSYAALPVLGLTRGRYKLVYDTATRRQRLFDLVNDPGETTDIATTRQAETAALYRDIVRAFVEAKDEAMQLATSPEAIQQLIDIGYLAGDADVSSPTEEARAAIRARLRRY